MAKLSYPQNLKGSTLIEVVASMVLISLALSLGFMLFTNLLNSHQTRLKQKARFTLGQVAEEIKAGTLFESDVIIQQEIYITRQRVDNFDNKSINTIILTAFDIKQRKLAERKELIWISR